MASIETSTAGGGAAVEMLAPIKSAIDAKYGAAIAAAGGVAPPSVARLLAAYEESLAYVARLCEDLATVKYQRDAALADAAASDRALAQLHAELTAAKATKPKTTKPKATKPKAAGGAGSETSSQAERRKQSSTIFHEPEDVEAWVQTHWATKLADPDDREAFISSKGEGSLTTQDVINVFHWVCGADDNLRRSHKHTARHTNLTSAIGELCERLTGYGTPTWKRGDRYVNMRGPRSVSSRSSVSSAEKPKAKAAKPKTTKPKAAKPKANAGAGAPPIAPVAILDDTAEPATVAGEVRVIAGDFYWVVDGRVYQFDDAKEEAGEYVGRLDAGEINTSIPEDLDELLVGL